MALWLILGGLLLAGCADVTESLNPANWGSNAAETEPVPGANEDFPNLSSVPEPPENVTSIEEIQQVEQALIADSANAQYSTAAVQRVDDETAIEPMPEPPPEVVEEEVIEEVVVDEEVEADGEVIDDVIVDEDVIIEDDVEIEGDDGAALEVVETEDVAIAEPEPEADVVDVVDVVEQADMVVAEPTSSEAVIMETEIAAPEPEILAPVGSPDDALPPQQVTRAVTTHEIVEDTGAAAIDTAEVLEVEVAEPAAATGQEGMSQTFDALFAASGPEAVAAASTTTITATGYQTLVAVIKFGEGSSALDANDRRIIKDLADAHGRQGGAIRLAGFASRDTGSSEDTDEMLVNLQISIDRATAVADELVRQGVASDDIVIDAQGAQASANLASGQFDAADQRRVDVYFTN
jgi:outer membrane protein OmpA-like peptidoglycan-associated protein